MLETNRGNTFTQQHMRTTGFSKLTFVSMEINQLDFDCAQLTFNWTITRGSTAAILFSWFRGKQRFLLKRVHMDGLRTGGKTNRIPMKWIGISNIHTLVLNVFMLEIRISFNGNPLEKLHKEPRASETNKENTQCYWKKRVLLAESYSNRQNRPIWVWFQGEITCSLSR